MQEDDDVGAQGRDIDMSLLRFVFGPQLRKFFKIKKLTNGQRTDEDGSLQEDGARSPYFDAAVEEEADERARDATADRDASAFELMTQNPSDGLEVADKQPP